MLHSCPVGFIINNSCRLVVMMTGVSGWAEASPRTPTVDLNVVYCSNFLMILFPVWEASWTLNVEFLRSSKPASDGAFTVQQKNNKQNSL